MKINVYRNQREIEKTIEVDDYDIMYGTVEDIFDILDGIENMNDGNEIVKVINDNRGKLNALLLDIFGEGGLTEEDLRMVKVKELVPVFIDLFRYVQRSFKLKN